jgi:hypothetical protein
MNLKSLDSWNYSPALCKHQATGFIPKSAKGVTHDQQGRQIGAETLLKKAPHTAEMTAATAKAGP